MPFVNFSSILNTRGSITPRTKSHYKKNDMEIAVDGQRTQNKRCSPYSWAQKSTSFRHFSFWFKCNLLLWVPKLKYRSSSEFHIFHQAAILRLLVQTKWAAYGSLFRKASLLTLALACGFIVGPCHGNLFLVPTLELELSYQNFRKSLELFCQKRETENKSKRENGLWEHSFVLFD